MTTAQMYFLVMLDSISCGALLAAVFLGLISFIFTIGYLMAEEMRFVRYDEFPRWIKVLWGSCVLSFLVSVFLPTTKQMAAIVVLPRIVNNSRVQEIPDKILDFTEAWIKEMGHDSLGKKGD